VLCDDCAVTRFDADTGTRYCYCSKHADVLPVVRIDRKSAGFESSLPEVA
jgi:hypothetical protein